MRIPKSITTLRFEYEAAMEAMGPHVEAVCDLENMMCLEPRLWTGRWEVRCRPAHRERRVREYLQAMYAEREKALERYRNALADLKAARQRLEAVMPTLFERTYRLSTTMEDDRRNTATNTGG